MKEDLGPRNGGLTVEEPCQHLPAVLAFLTFSDVYTKNPTGAHPDAPPVNDFSASQGGNQSSEPGSRGC